MIYGVGIDSVEIGRMEKCLANPAFAQRVFTGEERAYIAEKPGRAGERAAGIFCAKEAVAKALGCGLFGLRPNRIRIGHTDGGQPVVTIEAAEDRFPPLTFFLSVTHTRHTAQAVAVAEYRKEGAVCGR